MSTLRVIHIAPELPPTVGGVADYTAILSRRLVEVSNGAVEPVLVHAGKEPTDAVEVKFPVVDLSGQCSATALTDTVERLAGKAAGRAVVLLEYSGYGYATRGAPWWLARGLRRVCGGDGVPLVTMFHELYATGPPWTSAFWVSPVQRYVASRLAESSFEMLTTHRENAAWLRTCGNTSNGTVHVQPAFSNVGEPASMPSFDLREPQIAVFGANRRKRLIYGENRPLLDDLLNRQGFEQIIDLGPSKQVTLPDDERVVRRGILPASVISSVLSTVMLGVVSYPGRRLGKSGSVSALAAHGVPFLLLDEGSDETTDLYEESRHFQHAATVVDGNQSLSPSVLRGMSCAVRERYTAKIHSRHAASSVFGIMEGELSRPSAPTA